MLGELSRQSEWESCACDKRRHNGAAGRVRMTAAWFVNHGQCSRACAHRRNSTTSHPQRRRHRHLLDASLGRRPPVSLAVAVGLRRVLLVVSGDTSQSGHSTKHLLPVERCCSGYGVITPSLRHWKSRRWFLHALSLQEMRNRRRERERERENVWVDKHQSEN